MNSNLNWNTLLLAIASFATAGLVASTMLKQKKSFHSENDLISLISTASADQKATDSFRILQYNNLMYSLTDREKKLKFDRNFESVSEEIKNAQPDIFCLSGTTDEMYCSLLSEMGYKYIVASPSQFNQILFAYDTDVFAVEKTCEIDHSDLAGIFPPTKNEYPRNDFRKDNCALAVTLRHLKSGKCVQTVGMNFFWNPAYDHVKLAQLINSLLPANLPQSQADIIIPTIIFGDFSSRKHSNVVNWLTSPLFEIEPDKRVDPEKIQHYQSVAEKLISPYQGQFVQYPDSGDASEYMKSVFTDQETDQVSNYSLSFRDYKGFKTVDEIKDLYEFKNELGSGAFATVYKAINKLTEREVAVKVVKKSHMQKHSVYDELLRQELHVLEITDHPHITKVYEILEDNKCFYVVMELLEGGNLLDKIIQADNFNEEIVGSIVQQILLALNYMHTQNMVHRDIKLENLMCTKVDTQDFNIKLTDFGFAAPPDMQSIMNLTLGTPTYMAPELCREDPYDERVDSWSVGIVAYYLIAGEAPFYGDARDEIMYQIQERELQFNQPVWQKITTQAKDFITSCLIKDHKKRPHIKDLLESEWIQSVHQRCGQDQDAEKLSVSVSGFVAVKQMSEIKSGILSFLTNLLATTEELDELAETFKQINTSNDGFITKQELKIALQKSMRSSFFDCNNEDYDEILQTLSSNNEDQIDFAEFISAAYDHKRLFKESNLMAVFSILDREKSGYITKENFKTALSGGKNDQLMHNFEDCWKKITDAVNTKKEQQMDFEEFKTGMRIMKQITNPEYVAYQEEAKHWIDALFYTPQFLKTLPLHKIPEYHQEDPPMSESGSLHQDQLCTEAVFEFI